jgi:hypothetical protein
MTEIPGTEALLGVGSVTSISQRDRTSHWSMDFVAPLLFVGISAHHVWMAESHAIFQWIFDN